VCAYIYIEAYIYIYIYVYIRFSYRYTASVHGYSLFIYCIFMYNLPPSCACETRWRLFERELSMLCADVARLNQQTETQL